jgi:hypothetical protein
MAEETTTQDTTSANEAPKNPLMERIRIPGETFTLPSQGLFYKNGELSEDSKNGEVYIYPMVTFDEILFKTPDKLFSGEAIKDVFSRCVPSVKKPMDLLAKDVDFILVCLRKLTYGDIMEVTHTHDCKDAKEASYNIPISPFITNSSRIDPTAIAKSFSVTLENGQVLKLSPPRFKNVIKMYQAAMNESMYEDDIALLSEEVIDTIVGMIESVDQITDVENIREWVGKIPAGWIREISKSVSTVSDWGPNFDSKIECKHCKKEITISTPVNPLAFFI